MPIKILDGLPVKKLLEEEGIFSMDEKRAVKQDIRPLKLLILNLMPKKVETELQLLRLISQSPLQIDIDFLQTQTHEAKHTSQTYLQTFYKTFDDISHHKYDGLVVTGAPVEQLPFEEVDYWQEMTKILDWAQENVTSIVHICWGAQAGLYHYYGIQKVSYQKKLFGVYENTVVERHSLLRGFSDCFYSPQSRYTGINNAQLTGNDFLNVISSNPDLGALMLVSEDNKNIFIFGHLEYDANTLYEEYLRDKEKGLNTDFPENYAHFDDKRFKQIWRSEASLFFQNWINDVYQQTPYDWVL
ncbi:homoserine O-succinyltransferase [Vagococcus bubulae]|uniref:Homoserine O-acetyltransferase n=1 Tax=Vagococcus bubulae TaxID=1977868 RepID=A0A429ZQ71_9ENTE|nr:homoserine O-succinyltransferase [Vagococcus bubulae]RST95852.1 homoserine O-succinyltransferase [Vagococcus bubulae]